MHAQTAMRIIVNMLDLTAPELCVLSALVYGNGREFPAVETFKPYCFTAIERRARFSGRQCRRAIKLLEGRGLIVVRRKKGTQSFYAVSPTALLAATPIPKDTTSLLTGRSVLTEQLSSEDTTSLGKDTTSLVEDCVSLVEDCVSSVQGTSHGLLTDQTKEGGSAGEVEQPAPSVVPSPSLDEDGLHPWERADAVDNLGWPIEADETKGESDEQDRSSGDDAADRSSDEPDRGASRGAGNDAQGGRPPRPSGRAAGCEGDRAGEQDSNRADAVRARPGVVDPNEWVERIKTACSGPVGVDPSAPPGWAELQSAIYESAGVQSVTIVRELKALVANGHSLFKAQGLHTAALRVSAAAAGYQSHLESGSATPRALWIVERGCKQAVRAKAEAPKMRPLQPAGPRVVRNKTSAARFAALEQS